jgi:hypothetical protein
MSGVTALASEEWDFGKLQADEVYACWCWEFHRQVYNESKTIRDAVKKIRKGRKTNKNGLLGDPREFSDSAWLAGGHALYPTSIWPQKPFLSVEQSLRNRLSELQREVVSPPGEYQTLGIRQVSLRELPPGREEYWNENLVLREIKGPLFHQVDPIPHQTVVVALAVDFAKADKVLRDEFSKWLEWARKGMNPPARKKGTSDAITTQLADLKALGGLRLLKAYGTAPAARDASKLFAEESEWSKAKKRALDAVKELKANATKTAERLL